MELELYNVPYDQIAALFAVQPSNEQRARAKQLPQAVLYLKDPDTGGIRKVSRVFVEFERSLPPAFEEDMDG